MNDFEKYLKQNKEKMQLDSVNPQVWLSIENNLLKKKNRKNVFYIRIMAAAAAILLLAVVAFGLFSQQTKQDYLANFEPFNQEINTKKAQLASAKIPANRKADFEILLHQLEFLDNQYHDYLQYIDQNGYQEFIGQQILQYYKTKIDLLDKIQQEIEKIEYYENKFQSKSKKVGLDI